VYLLSAEFLSGWAVCPRSIGYLDSSSPGSKRIIRSQNTRSTFSTHASRVKLNICVWAVNHTEAPESELRNVTGQPESLVPVAASGCLAFDHNVHRSAILPTHRKQELVFWDWGTCPFPTSFVESIQLYWLASPWIDSAVRSQTITPPTQSNAYCHRWNHPIGLLRAPWPDLVYPSFTAFPCTLAGSLCSRTLLSDSEW